MAKGQRKRANKPKPQKQPRTKKKKQDISFNPQAILKKYHVKPLMQLHGNMMQESVKLSNKFSQVLKNQSDREFALKKMEIFIDKLKNGKIKPPVIMKQSENIFVPRYNLNEIKKEYEHDAKILRDSIKILEGQASHWYDEYRDSLVRLYSFLDIHLGENKEIARVHGHRKGTNPKILKKEAEIFEQEFDKKVEDLTDEDKKYLKNIAKSEKKDAS
jgi:hypothetical protein